MAYREPCSNTQTKWTIGGVATVILVLTIGLVLCFTMQFTRPGRGLPTLPSGWLSPFLTLHPHQDSVPINSSLLLRSCQHASHPHLCVPLPLPATPSSPQHEVPLASSFPSSSARLQVPEDHIKSWSSAQTSLLAPR